MANPEKGEFELIVGETTYTLTLKTAALMALQKRFSTDGRVADLGEIFALVLAGSLEHVVAFLWASMLKFHPEMTMARVIDLIDESEGLETITQQLEALSGSAHPDPKDAEELGPRPLKAQARRRGTGGSGSSRRAASG